MAFYQVPAPDLSGLTLGEATLRLLEAYGFSSDESLLLVRATYTDTADPGSGLHFGFFVFDLQSQTYIANINTLVAGSANPDSLDITNAVITGTASDWVVTAQVRAEAVAVDRLVQVTEQGVSSGNLIQAVTGSQVEVQPEHFDVSGDGRFVAIQTSDWQLASNLVPDTNDSSDVYVLDTLTGEVTRASLAGGAQVEDPVYLQDISVRDGTLQILLTTDGAMVSPSRVDLNSSDLTAPAGTRTDLYLWSDGVDLSGLAGNPAISLQSVDTSGVAAGFVNADFGAQITDSGILFSSDSELMSQDDSNATVDAFAGDSGVVERILAASGQELESGSQFLTASRDGSRVAILTLSTEYGGREGVNQIVLIDQVSGTQEVVSNNGKSADNVAIAGLLSDSGYTLAFTTYASNLVSDPLEANGTGLFVNQMAEPIGGQIYHWSKHSLMSGVDVSVYNVLSSGDVDLLASTSSGLNGDYSLVAAPSSDRLVTASLAVTDSDVKRVITSADALATLKIAVGLNPNTDPDGDGPLTAPATSPYQLIAGDVNQDGRITSADALAILKMAVGLSTSVSPEWLFVPQSETFWQDNGDGTGSYTVDRNNVEWSRDGLAVGGRAPDDADLVAVLLGDVNGSWNPPQDAPILPDEYFRQLEQDGYGPAGKWDVVPIP
jgi:hypothetical protein